MKTNMTTGIVENMSNADYHANPALSSSGLKELARSPAHYQAYRKGQRIETRPLLIGTSLHDLVGEPALFAKKYVKGPRKEDFKKLLITSDDLTATIKAINPEAKLPKKKGDLVKLLLELDPKAEIWDEITARFSADNAGKTILTAEEFDQLDGMLGSLLSSKTVLHLYSGGKAEQSIFWVDPETGVACRCRPDYLRADGIIVDLKTTADDASQRGFQRSAASFRYDLQSAFYLEGVSHVLGEPLEEFVHVVVEKKPPYSVGLYALSGKALTSARAKMRSLLSLYADCSIAGQWPAYSPHIEPIDMPAYLE